MNSAVAVIDDGIDLERLAASAIDAEIVRVAEQEHIFNIMATDIAERGYSICPNALGADLLLQLRAHILHMPSSKFKQAGIGRETDLSINQKIRTDAICWIEGDSAAGKSWLRWSDDLRSFLNRELFLGLFSFESHFAHYSPGDFYQTHQDSFRGEANRVLSLVVYLNDDWCAEDGGELVIYTDDDATLEKSVKVIPNLGTVVLFLSEEFPHEVLPARRDRYSIAGWFRVNNSNAQRVDPPR